MPTKRNLKRSRSTSSKRRPVKHSASTRSRSTVRAKSTTRSKAKTTRAKVKSRPVQRKSPAKKSRLRLRWAKSLSMLLAIVVVGGLFLAHNLTKADTINGQPAAIASGSVNGQGYWILGKDGGIFSENSHFYGSEVGNIHTQNYNFVGMAASPTTATVILGGNAQTTVTGYNGYFLVDQDGHVYTFGSAKYRGGVNQTGAGNIVGIASNSNGSGYWILGNNGAIYSYGATFYGAATSHTTDFVGIASTPDGKGYWLVDRTGHIFGYGDAHYRGGTTVGNIVGIASDATGGGYWLTDTKGDVYPFGDAKSHGSMTGKALAKPIVAIAATSDGGGYWLLGSDGGVFSFGNAGYKGRVSYQPSAPVISSCSTSVSNNSVVPATVTISSCASKTTQPGATISSVSVNWGNASSSSLPASHTYTAAGSFKISVTVTDSNNQPSAAKLITGTLTAPPIHPSCESNNTCSPSCKSTNSCAPSCESNNSCSPSCESNNTCSPSCKSTNSCTPSCAATKTCTPPAIVSAVNSELSNINSFQSNVNKWGSIISGYQSQVNSDQTQVNLYGDFVSCLTGDSTWGNDANGQFEDTDCEHISQGTQFSFNCASHTSTNCGQQLSNWFDAFPPTNPTKVIAVLNSYKSKLSTAEFYLNSSKQTQAYYQNGLENSQAALDTTLNNNPVIKSVIINCVTEPSARGCLASLAAAKSDGYGAINLE